MPADIFNNDVSFRQQVDMRNATGGVFYRAGSIVNQDVSTSAAIAASKLQHRHKVGCNFGLEEDAAPSTGTTYSFVAFRASAPCTINSFIALLTDTGTQDNTNNFSFELKKATAGSGSFATILSAPIDVDSDIADNTSTSGSLSSATLVAGDVLLVEVTTPATITGAHGMWASVEIDEAAS